MNSEILGNKVIRWMDGRPRSIIGRVKVAPVGNLVLEVGQENHPLSGWTKTEHVVLVPQETAELAKLMLLRGLTPTQAREVIGQVLKQLADQPDPDEPFESACQIVREHEAGRAA